MENKIIAYVWNHWPNAGSTYFIFIPFSMVLIRKYRMGFLREKELKNLDKTILRYGMFLRIDGWYLISLILTFWIPTKLLLIALPFLNMFLKSSRSGVLNSRATGPHVALWMISSGPEPNTPLNFFLIWYLWS